MTDRFMLTDSTGQKIDPERLKAEAQKAGEIDADNGRFSPQSFSTAEARAAYEYGHKVGSARQGKRWGGKGWNPAPTLNNAPRTIDPRVSDFRSKLHRP